MTRFSDPPTPPPLTFGTTVRLAVLDGLGQIGRGDGLGEGGRGGQVGDGARHFCNAAPNHLSSRRGRDSWRTPSKNPQGKSSAMAAREIVGLPK